MRKGDMMDDRREIVATVTLLTPVKFGSEEISVLEFEEPDLNALDCMERASKQSGVNAVMKLIEKCANVAPVVTQKIKGRDLQRIMKELGPFLPKENTPDLGDLGGDA